jgi:hypothetical protein
VVEPIEEMPPGTLGFRAHGRLTRADYRETLIPTLREAVESGPVRLLFVIADDFEKLDFGARIEDAKADLSFALEHGAWERTALVTDVSWVRRLLHLFNWLAPGELRLFALAEEDEARAWVGAA